MYLIAKHTHLTLIAISVLFLLVRIIARCAGASWLDKKWARVSPHIIDTFLLLSAFYLMSLLQQYPFVNTWLTAKVIALLGYIGFATLALKGQKPLVLRLVFAALSLSCIGYMGAVAVSKSAIFF
ncbi:MAG: SirB2 family protein [Pseudomonadales bacterium]